MQSPSLAFRSWAALAGAALVLGCGARDAGRVADRFVDKYYVESDQEGALAYTDGVATLRLREELRLVAEGRRPGMDMAVRPVRVYYKRVSLEGKGEERTAEYELDIRPQGGGEMQRHASLELHRAPDGGWRVVRFYERQRP